jgi:predicted GIY-YIG superfamily endonuclease
MGRGLVYTLHLWPPIAHAKHYTGYATSEKRLPERLTDHALGRGARLTQVQVERGGSWVVAQTEPGDGKRERSLKQHGASRRCEVCKAVEGYQAGELSQEQALGRAGWDRASEHERGLLLDMFGLSQAPQPAPAQPADGPRPDMPAPQPGPAVGEVRVVPAPRPAPAAQYITPEIVALVDQLEQGWTAGAESRPGAQARQAAAEPEMEPQA